LVLHGSLWRCFRPKLCDCADKVESVNAPRARTVTKPTPTKQRKARQRSVRDQRPQQHELAERDLNFVSQSACILWPERMESRVDNWQLQQCRQRSQPWRNNLPLVERRGSRVDNWELQQCRQRSQPWRNNPPLVV
jgi:hypothetical protein